MKKLVFLMALLFATTGKGQYLNQDDEPEKPKFNFAGSIGFLNTSIDALGASPSGLNIGIDILNFHIGIGTNGATGSGEYLDFESSETYEIDKRSWFLINFGIDIFLFENQGTNFFIRPKMGFAEIYNIYNDPIAFDTHFKEEYKKEFNLGVDVLFQFPNNHQFVVIGAGPGMVEIFNIGLGYGF